MNGPASPARNPTYIGVLEDEHAGLTTLLGRIVRDAWVFGLLPETETCAGWNAGQMKALQEKVNAAWEPYSSLPSLLTPELRERHGRIYDEAIRLAQQQGWNADLDDDDE